jgi:hypothetical protein
VPEAVSSTDESRGNQDQAGSSSRTSADDEAKPNVEKGLEKVATKQNKTQDEETEIRAEIVASSQQQPNRIVRFDKPDHPISPVSG